MLENIQNPKYKLIIRLGVLYIKARMDLSKMYERVCEFLKCKGEFIQENKTAGVLSVIGASYLTYKYLKLQSAVYRYFLRPSYDLKKRYGGEYAVITGASVGIGRAYAFALAKRGFNLVLIARTKFDLETVQQEIREKYSEVITKIIPFDLSEDVGSSAYQTVIRGVQDLDISILVNNVGMARAYQFHEFPQDVLRRNLNVNIGSYAFMTRLILPGMVNRFAQEGKKSAIINVSSVAENGLVGYRGIYCATKAFVTCFSRALAIEYKGKVDFLCTTPGNVTTRMNPGKGLKYISARDCAENHLDFVGKDTQVYGHWKHYLSDQYVRYLQPQSIRNSIGWNMVLYRQKKDREDAQH